MALVNPNIAMSFRQPEFKPRNAMAEYAQMQQIEGGQRQAEVADMQLESLRRDRDALGQIQAAIVAKGGPPDLDAAADAMIKTGRPEYVTQGMAIRTALRNQRGAEAYRRDFGGGAAPAMPTLAPAAPAMPSSAPNAMAAPAELAAGAQPEPMAPVPGVISTSRVPGVTTAPISMSAVAGEGVRGIVPVNTLAPPAAAPVNAMLAPAAVAAAPTAPAAPDANAARLRALEAQYRRIGNNPELASEKALVLKQIEDVQQTIRAESATPPEAKFMRALGIPLTRQGFTEFEALKQRPGEFERLLSQSGLPKTDQTALIRERLRKEVTHTPGTTVNVSTEKKYGERFGGLIADRDAGKLDAAEGAPRVIENSDRIMDILATGKVFTGTGANVRLQLAKALNLAGGTDTDRIANTEVLISSLANSTLGAIKSSNLGAGQGFTNADRDFLEKASAGQLTYDSASLRKLAELGRKAGVASIESWNSRVQQIPKSALEGLGISASPLPVPSRRPSSVMNIPQGAIDMLKSGAGTREQFDAQFGPGSADRVLPKGK
jgi:hypothetical protein